jgi:hypothetical protein
VDDGAGGVVAVEHRRQQVGDVAVVADVAVLAGQGHLAAAEEVVEAAAVGLVAEAEQDADGDVALGEAAAQQGEWSDADAAADEDRTGGARLQLARLGEGVAERPRDPDVLSRRTPPAAGPVSATESARGRNGLSPAPLQCSAVASM